MYLAFWVISVVYGLGLFIWPLYRGFIVFYYGFLGVGRFSGLFSVVDGISFVYSPAVFLGR